MSGAIAASGVVARGRALFGGNKQLSIPGLLHTTDSSTYSTSANRAHYFPMLVDSSITIDQIVLELTTGVAASTSRIALYNADTDWQPTSLVSGTDSGAFNTAAADQGVKTFSLSDTVLAAGRYLAWINCSANGLSWRSERGSAGPTFGYPTALGSNPGFTQVFASQTFGAPPSTGLAWDTVSTGAVHTFSWIHWLRVKTP